MEKEKVRMLLEILRQYNTMRITQLFSKDNTAWIRVRCLRNTQILELQFSDTDVGEYYELVHEAVDKIICKLDVPSSL